MNSSNFDLSKLLENKSSLSLKEQLSFVRILSIPGILAQISSIIMQYIDAAMVGSLGADAAASIGLTASSTWVLGSLSHALTVGFTVQVAHAVGGGKKETARAIFFKSIIAGLVFAIFIAFFSLLIHKKVPLWLGGKPEIQEDAAFYFLIFGLSTPFYLLIYLMGGMLQCSGNMKIPGIMNILLCVLDAFFNVIFIHFLHLGVKGAALGSAVSAIVVAILISYFAIFKSEYLNLKKFRSFYAAQNYVSKAIKLAFPVALEQTAFTGALVAVTKIIAPLGSVALAANSFATTAEALCYMPGYGIQEAATTLVGQSTGAKRKDLADSFSWITVFSGMAVMALTGIFMFFLCPYIFNLLTPDKEVQVLAIKILRIELFAEPFFAAAIISTGALRGRGDTFIPSILIVISLWIVRLGLSILLVKPQGLSGIWIAMATELTFRGTVLMARLLYVTKKK